MGEEETKVSDEATKTADEESKVGEEEPEPAAAKNTVTIENAGI